MTHNERIPLGLRVIAINLALAFALVGAFPLASCTQATANPASEHTEDDPSGAEGEDDELEDDAGPAREELSVAEFVHQAALKNCAAFERCLGPGARTALSGNECAATRGQVLEDSLSGLEPLIADGHVRFDRAAAEACLTKLPAIGCDALRNAAELDCPDVFTGTRALGAACDRDLECADDAYCALSAACPGICAPRLTQGQECFGESECELPLTCLGGRCLATVGEGQFCDAERPCSAAATCVGAISSQGVPGTCAPLAEAFMANEGDACDFNFASYCAPGLSCVVAAVGHTGGVVAYCERPSARDAACSFGFPTPCPEGQYCDADPKSGSYEGDCRDLPRAGEVCVTVSGAPPCAAGLICADAVPQRACKPPGRIGDACEFNPECRSQHCAGGECRAGFGCEL